MVGGLVFRVTVKSVQGAAAIFTTLADQVSHGDLQYAQAAVVAAIVSPKITTVATTAPGTAAKTRSGRRHVRKAAFDHGKNLPHRVRQNRKVQRRSI